MIKRLEKAVKDLEQRAAEMISSGKYDERLTISN